MIQYDRFELLILKLNPNDKIWQDLNWRKFSGMHYKLDKIIHDTMTYEIQWQDLNRRKFSGMLYKLDESVGLVVEALQNANMLQVQKILCSYLHLYLLHLQGLNNCVHDGQRRSSSWFWSQPRLQLAVEGGQSIILVCIKHIIRARNLKM